MKRSDSTLHYRPLMPADIGHVPLQHQGTPEAVRARVAACGWSAMLVFDGTMCVGQLQFRPYVPDTVSPNGLHDPLYWMDFNGSAPALPAHTLTLFCYHVGQLDDTDVRDTRYFGRGIGYTAAGGNHRLGHQGRFYRHCRQGIDGATARYRVHGWPASLSVWRTPLCGSRQLS